MSSNPEDLAGTVLCQVGDLAATKAKDVIIKNGDEQHSIMVVEWHGDIHAYVNSCPHARVPLNMLGDTFFDLTGKYLLCTMHGAHFRPSDGYCTRGPCRGKSLRPFPIKVEGDNVVVVQEGD
ncbi:MAG: Rieske (2Fe-2S) protein [Rhodospirillaceae bacterium]|nr:Rieske (2Fe-2S) protein [Rhodospirillaceae bacterium]